MSRSAHRHIRQRAASLSLSAFDTAALADGPVAFWTLGGGSAGAADRTGNGHDGTYAGLPLITAFPDGSHATVFDGASQYLEVTDADDLSVTATGILTIEAWIRPDTLQFANQEGSGYVHWMGKGEANQHEYVGRMYSLTNTESRPNRISGYSFNLAGGLGTGSYFQDSVSVGEWIHFVLIINTVNTNAQYTTGYTQVYKNGEQRDKDALTSYSTIPGNGTAPFRIGTRDMQSFFQGAIGKVAVYDYELPAATIRSHYQTVVPPLLGSTTFAGHVGTAGTKTTGTTLSLTIPAAGVPAGRTLIVKVAHAYTVSGPAISDSKGNVYTRDRTAPNSGTTMRASLFSAPINAALEPGDTILLTTPVAVDAKSMCVDQFSGIVFSGNTDQFNSTSATSTTPGTTIPVNTTNADDLLVGFAAVNGPDTDAYNEDTVQPWNTLTRIGTSGGADTTNITLNNAYRTVGTTGTYHYRPTLGTSRSWIEIVGSYIAGTPIITPPVIGTAVLIRNVGTLSSKASGNTLVFSVAGEPIPVGHTLIIRVVHDHTAGGPTMTDSRGNTYTRDRTAANGGLTLRASIFSCRITTALQVGDSITLTLSASVTARAASVDQFANILHPISIDVQNGLGGTSAAPSLPVTTTNANDLVVGMVGVEGDVNDSYTEDTFHQWTSLSRGGTTGGTFDSNVTIDGAYRAAGAAGTYTYAPTLGTSSNWIAFLIAYRAN